jgi:hypothetical protein
VDAVKGDVWRRIGIAVVIGGLALVAGCADSEEPATTGESVEHLTTSTATDAAPTTPAETEPVAAQPDAVVVRVFVKEGRSAGGIRRATVSKGDRVRLVVLSDTTDEVHLHGYDLTTEVAPGRQGRIVFVAKVPGRFEIELEEAGVQIGELEVRP